MLRELAFIRKLISRHQLDMSGLVVLTELASGPYLFNPLVAALSGADVVIAYGRDSEYGTFDSLAGEFRQRFGQVKESANVVITDDLDFALARDSDVVTNSGHLRPLNRRFLERLKKSAVVPLMWETWEFRPEELDLEAAKDLGILVLGTEEAHPLCDMRPYSALAALKLVIQHRIMNFGNRVLVVGEQITLGVPIHRALLGCGLDAGITNSHDLREFLTSSETRWDYVLVAEHGGSGVIIGPSGNTSPTQLAARGVSGVGVVSGKVDAASLAEAGIDVMPSSLKDGLHMSFSPVELGPEASLELFAAGLAVGTAMARMRRKGAGLTETVRFAKANSPAMDFPGAAAWVQM